MPNPSNLTPELLALLQQQYAIPQGPSSGSGWSMGQMAPNMGTYTEAGGQTWHPGYSGGSGPSGEAGVGNQEAYNTLGYAQDVNPGHNAVGDMQNMYDPHTGQFQYSAAVPKKDNGLSMAAMFLAPLALQALVFGGLPGMAGAGLEAGAGLGAANGSWDILPEAIGGGGGGGMMTSAMGAGPAAGGASETLPYLSSEMASVPGSFAAPAGLGGAESAFTLPSMTSSGLSSVSGPISNAYSGASGIAGLLGQWGGPAASLLGGLLGSRGTENSTTQRNELDPRMAALLYGDGGFLPQAQQQFQAMQGPTMQSSQQLRALGTSLLNQPIAGNGFTGARR